MVADLSGDRDGFLEISKRVLHPLQPVARACPAKECARPALIALDKIADGGFVLDEP